MSRATTPRLRVVLALGLTAGLLAPATAHAEDAEPVATLVAASASAAPTPSVTAAPEASPVASAPASPPSGVVADASASASPEASTSPSTSPSTSVSADHGASGTTSTRASETADAADAAESTAPQASAPETSAHGSPGASSSPSAAREAASSAASGMAPGGRVTRFGLNAAATGPATSTDPALVGAHFLEQELIDSDYLMSGDFGPQYGLVADAVLALAAAGTGQDAGTAATAVLADNVVNYTGFGDPTEVYAGATAKLLNVAVAQGVDPTSFGSFDLVATLQGLQAANGRFSDQSAWGDYSNVFGQSLAIIGLKRAASVDDVAVDYLKGQQCSNGGFPTPMADAGCTDDSTAEVDATAFAVQALLAADGAGSPEAADGLDYLAAEQRSTGGFGGGSLQPGDNSNSTGLAVQALLAGGRTAQVGQALAFLTPLQFGCPAPDALRGAIAYDQAAYDAAGAAGSAAQATDQELRATPQALLALAGVPLGSVTNAGATAQAPALACSATTATTTPSPDPTGTTTASPTSSGADSSADVEAESSPESGQELANTGANPLAPASLGIGLLLVGLAALTLSRRRGAHE